MGEREMEIMSENLRVEYTRQIENIKKLRTLYEQRARSADLEIESLKRKLADRNKDIENEVLKLVFCNRKNHEKTSRSIKTHQFLF